MYDQHSHTASHRNLSGFCLPEYTCAYLPQPVTVVIYPRSFGTYSHVPVIHFSILKSMLAFWSFSPPESSTMLASRLSQLTPLPLFKTSNNPQPNALTILASYFSLPWPVCFLSSLLWMLLDASGCSLIATIKILPLIMEPLPQWFFAVFFAYTYHAGNVQYFFNKQTRYTWIRPRLKRALLHCVRESEIQQGESWACFPAQV